MAGKSKKSKASRNKHRLKKRNRNGTKMDSQSRKSGMDGRL